MRATLLAVMLLLGACQTSGTTSRDIGGGLMHLAEWRDIRPHEIRINVVDAPMAATIYGARQRTRDNAVLHQEADFDQGWIFVEYLHTPGDHYDALTVRRLKSQEASRERLRGILEGLRPAYVDSRLVEQHGRLGWAHLIKDPRADERTCAYGWVAALSPAKVVEHKPGAVYDTTVEVLDCSMAAPFAQMVDFLSGLKVVKPAYNRAGM